MAAVTPKKKLTDSQRKAVDYIEQTFWETGGIPTVEKVVSETGVSGTSLKKWWDKDEIFRKALIARGIDLAGPENSEKQLTPQQLLCANVLLNTHDKRTEREKLEFLGISSQQYHAWRRQPAFSSYINRRAEAVFESSTHKAFQNIINNVEADDLNAAKLMLELQGKYRQQVDVNINIETVVVTLVEIVAKHVKDPEIIQAIANEIERTLTPELEAAS